MRAAGDVGPYNVDVGVWSFEKQKAFGRTLFIRYYYR